MRAAEALKAAQDAGIALQLDGDDLVLQAHDQPPAEIIDILSRNKPAIVSLLRQRRGGWSAEDWHAFFEERVAIAEFDGGLPRHQAEARAFACCVAEMLNCNFEPSPPERCLACGGADHAHDALLPHGTETTGHVWLHSSCWPDWHARRKAEAVVALAGVGIALCEKGVASVSPSFISAASSLDVGIAIT
jgi:hypothetical protein